MKIIKEEKINKSSKLLIFFIVLLLFLSSFLLISCGRKKVPVESIAISQENTTLFKGQTKKLYLDIQPEDAYGYTISWSSSDSKTVSVDRMGYIEGKKYGFATITAQIKGTDIYASCNVIVNDGSITSISVNNVYDIYYEGQVFDQSTLKVYAVYESGKKELLEAGSYTVEAPATLSLDSEIKITYGSLPSKTIYPIVRKDYVLEMQLDTMPTKTSYVIGEEFDSAGMKVNLLYASGKVEETTDYTIDTQKVAFKQTSVKLTYSDFSISVPITTKAQIIVSSISALQSAIDAGYTSIMLEEGSYNTTTQITITSKENILIYGQTSETSINGWNIIPIKIAGECGNVTLIDITFASIGETPTSSQIDLSECTAGNITLTNLTYTSILQPESPLYSLFTNS